MNDPRVGTMDGNKKPVQTLCGFEAIQPFGMTIGIGGDYYVVRDIFPCPDWEEKLAALKAQVSGQKSAKVGRE